MSTGQQFIRDKGYSKHTQVRTAALRSNQGKVFVDLVRTLITVWRNTSSSQIQVLPAGGETTLFKQFFSDWKDKDQTTGPTKAYTIGRIAKVEQIPFDASKLHSNKTMAAHHGMVDNGKGKVQVRVCEKGP